MDKNNLKDNLTDILTDTDSGQLYGQVLDKIQKLTGALYRVTDLYSDKEPLKWTLRDNAIYLHTNLLSVIKGGRMSIRKSIEIDEILNSIVQMIRTLELSALGGFVADINFEILKKEYTLLKDFLESGQGDILNDRKLLIEPEHLFAIGSMAEKTPMPAPKENNENNKPKYYNTQPRTSIDASQKREKIISFLKRNGKTTVKEVASLFEEASEKTVQRYLFDLVKSGELTAEGEKRWRKYCLSKKPR